MPPILPDLLRMSLRYFQILTSVIWLIIIAPRVALIVQTLQGHSSVPARLDISGMAWNAKVYLLFYLD